MEGKQVFLKIGRKAGMFLKRNSATVLSVVGAVGVVATVVVATKATTKAQDLLNQAKEEKGEDLTKLEMVKAAGPAYIPTVLLGASTIACILGANVLNKRQQAALVSAYALVDTSFKNYKKKVEELYGEGANSEVRREIVKDQYAGYEKTDDTDKELFYDAFSNRYFESTMADVLKAEYEINRMLSMDTGIFLNEFYELLGLDTVDYGDYLGWSSFELVETYWYQWIEFEHETVVMDDGLKCTIIHMAFEPTYDFENY